MSRCLLALVLLASSMASRVLSRPVAESQPVLGPSTLAEYIAASSSPFFLQKAVVSWEVEQFGNLYRQAGNSAPTVNVLKGGMLVFLWAKSHTLTTTVYEFPDPASLDACDFSVATEVKGPGFPHYHFLSATEAGKRYFSCSYPGHCAAGMRLVVSVTSW